MKNISITLLLNAILRVEYWVPALARGDTDNSVLLKSIFSTAGYMLN